MAGPRWRTGTPLIKRLLREPHRFDFFQAVRLLEFMQPGKEPVGAGLAAGREAVRFRASQTLEFPASDVVDIHPPRHPGDVPEITVSFMGLTGTNGPLPRPFTELVVERVARKDPGMRDFLDIFHHRLISLLYRVRKKSRIALHAESPETAEVADRTFALNGLGTLGLRDRMGVNDRALLRYTGLLSQRPRSMHGLEQILRDYFRVPVKARPFVGQWLELDPEQRTSLGLGGGNNILGDTAVLGGRVWDQQSKFELEIGPLSRNDFSAFLPGADRLAKLAGLARFYVGPDLDFDIRLKLREDEVPQSRLGAEPGPRLGWTSWLPSSVPSGDVEIVIRDPEGVVADAAGGPRDEGHPPPSRFTAPGPAGGAGGSGRRLNAAGYEIAREDGLALARS